MHYYDINMADVEYLNLAKKILQFGEKKEDRTGTGTISLFGPQIEFDLQQGFPLLTTKRLPFRVIAEELYWFISGSTNLKDLLDKNVHIWDDDAYRFYLEQGGTINNQEEFIEMVQDSEEGFDLGPIYGRQWANFNGQGVNQLDRLVQEIKENAHSRRHVVSAWNPVEVDKGALPPCHTLFQMYVGDGKLSCKLYQRSADFFLGVPFNIASYSLLTHLVAKMVGLKVGRFIHTFGDAHIYLNHIKQIELQMTRTPRALPKLEVKTVHEKLSDYTMDDLELIGYDPHPTIKGKVSVGLKK